MLITAKISKVLVIKTPFQEFTKNWTEIHKNLQCVVVLLGAGLWAWHASAVGGAKRLLLMSIVVDVLRPCFTDLTEKNI